MLSLGLLCEEMGYSNEWKRESLHHSFVLKRRKVIRCKSENQVPTFAAKNLVHPMTLRRRRATDCKLQVPDHQETGSRKVLQSDVPSQEKPGQPSGDRLHVPGVQAQGNWSHQVPDWFSISQKASLAKSPTHTMSWWNDLKLSQ